MTHSSLSTDEGAILHFGGTQAGISQDRLEGNATPFQRLSVRQGIELLTQHACRRLQDSLEGNATPFHGLSVRQGIKLLTQHACGTHAWGRQDGPGADRSPDSSRP